jgi:hypothetical protein
MSQAYSGVQGNILISGNDVDAQGWSADVEANSFDSTTTADGGWDDETGSTSKISGSFDFFYNKAKPPFGSLGVTPNTVAILKLYVHLSDGNFLTGSALIKKVSFKTKVKEGFVLTASFMGKGIWTLPST